jgi:predicted AlkP superfamily pyrophosphatase or phosphodiesterase
MPLNFPSVFLRLFIALLWLAPVWAGPHYVLVIGIDGFRQDYAEKFQAKNLLALRDRGAGVRVRPYFPSSTFPNFYSMATGLRPDEHGIVAMNFYDRTLRTLWSYRTNADDGRFYGGSPWWNHVRTGAYFWPGSAAAIGGKRPWQSFPYDPKTTHEEKIKTVLGWFALPEAERPQLSLVYFADVDQAGHAFGPDSPEMRAAVEKVDAAVGALVAGVAKSGLPVDIVVVSDHGMMAVKKTIDLSTELNYRGFMSANDLSMVMLYNDDPQRRKDIYKRLRHRSKDYRVIKRDNLPRGWYYNGNPRIGDLLIIPNGPYIVYLRADEKSPPVPELKGMHGYDPGKYHDMNGICYAAGPQIKKGENLKVRKSSDVYGLIERLLGTSTPPRR